MRRLWEGRTAAYQAPEAAAVGTAGDGKPYTGNGDSVSIAGTAAGTLAAKDVGTRLATVTCPTHGTGPTDVRLHFDASGAGDLKYQSCCKELGDAIAKLL